MVAFYGFLWASEARCWPDQVPCCVTGLVGAEEHLVQGDRQAVRAGDEGSARPEPLCCQRMSGLTEG